MGVYGLAIPGPWGEAPVSMPCYALVTAELSRGWMSLAGAMGGHPVVAKLLLAFGTREHRITTCQRWPPARSAPRWRSPSLVAALTCRRSRPRPPGRRLLPGQRVENLDQQRAPVGTDRAAGRGRPGRAAPAQGRLDPAGRARTGTDPFQGPVQAGLQGRGVVRAGLRGLPRTRRGGAGRGRGPWLRADDEGPGDRPDPGRLPRARGPGPRSTTPCATPRSGKRSASRSGSTSRSAAPGRHGHQGHRGPAADPARGRAVRIRAALRHEGRHGQLFASEIAMEVALDAVRIHGGYGYSTEYDVEQYSGMPADDRRRGHQRDPAQRHRRPARQARRPGRT